MLANLQKTPSVLKLDPSDNVGVATRAIGRGTVVGVGVTALADIATGHKLALAAIALGAPVRKYGQVIGFASRPITAGEHVHTHNCEMGALALDFTRTEESGKAGSVQPPAPAYFQGIVRPNGRVATRNYLAVLTSVNCSAAVATGIVERFRTRGLSDFPNVDGVMATVHGQGCGMAGSGEGYELLQRTLAGFARHPNFTGALIAGLGCEVNQPKDLCEHQGLIAGDLLQTLSIQDAGGTLKAIERGVQLIEKMLPVANQTRRESVSASHLMLALQCGGSDGYSGITANPALGRAVDLLVAQGGTAILSETPEIYGAEHLLIRRAVTSKVAEKLMARLAWWESYTKKHGAEMNNNPSPGNKAGGLTTILEKSLGAVAKCGTSPLVDVYEYAEPITQKGFVFMDSPGYDPCSATGQVASGANILCFTTGRGSVFGCKPTPSIKLATSTGLFERMREDMDVNCGDIIDGGATIASKGQEIFELILRVASGEKSKSELLGIGDQEFVPWQIGAVM
ncbi:MAG: altronate dehydratase family protein [Polyangiaceae bacterium]|nr:altronate dehydratase family protein [Polyangiaceae bacterium]